MACVALRGINKTAWDAKLILTADLANPVSCASLGHLQHCHFCLIVCFSLPTAPHLPPPPAPTSPTCPPPIDSIHNIIAV